MATPGVVCVLGMHRSGTSAVTRLLNLLGVQLGPEARLMAADRFNPSGFWEHQEITELDDALLERLGGSWRDPPALPDGWWTTAALDPLREQAKALIRRDFGEAKLWGWKDPRTCLTLPFWRSIVAPTHYVICVRNPVEVARSLEHTMPFEHGIGLWLEYVRASLAHSPEGARLFVFYDELMRAWRVNTRRLGFFLGRERRAHDPEVTSAARGFLSHGLRHHRASFAELVADQRVPLTVKALYASLCVETRRDDPAGSPRLPERALQALGRAVGEAQDGGVGHDELERLTRSVAAP